MIEIGDQAPSFELPDNHGGTVALPSGQPMIVYFYPKDDTPGCTNEAKDFSHLKSELEKLGVGIVGISPDTVGKHEKFAAKHGLTITLAADEEKSVIKDYGAWVEKSMYGRTYMGVDRSTFLIDDNGKIVEAWRKVRVKGHADAVMNAARKHFG